MASPFKDVIAQLERQQASIARALAALREVDATDDFAAKTKVKAKGKANGKRKISAEGRQRMVEAQRKRWAAKRAVEAGATKKAAVKKKGPKKAASPAQ